jgi:hypothetical protein
VKTKKIAALNDYAKTDAVAKAKGDAKFFVVPESDFLKKDAEGNIVLSKDADVAVIRKEDLAETGYGEDSGTEDPSGMGDEGGEEESKWPEPEEVKAHVQALDKCRGALMKGAGMRDEDVYGDPAGTGENNDMDEALKAIRSGDLKKAADAVAALDAKRAARGSSGVTADSISKMLDAKLTEFAKAFEGRLGGAKEIQPRQGAGGEVVKKDGVSTSTAATDAKGMYAKLSEQLDVLKQERTSFLEKAANKIALTPQEELRKSKISEEINHAETALQVLVKNANHQGVALT